MGVSACRGWHDPLPFDECQPYALMCACPYADDLDSEPQNILRHWQCETEDQTLDAIRRRSSDVAADDTHFYGADDGVRVASVREHDAPVGVCGQMLQEEWWGDILDCTAICEHDPSLPEAETLPPCE